MITLGIDIGGSATKGALVDTETGKMVSERIRYETETLVKPREVAALVEKIRKKLGYHGIIGAGYPGVVKNGVAMTAANLHKNWIGTDVAALIFNQTGQVTTVLNDADAAGLAEMRFGVEEARQYKTVLFLTVGTGIGSALFVDGHLIPNTELGHLKIRGKDAEHRASDAVRQRENLSWKKWGKRFTEVLQTYEFLFNPDLFILGGGISSKYESYAEYLKINTKILPAKLENTAGIIGAGMAAHEASA
ncbi:MAG: ROK family protein [Chloroflexi bacterium]|jgi:polyphosphate glucokinase|nr:ROK family protein [Anaerolineaceae bacterium]NLI43915.1 ROK family protein [Chloroflexota bacterium]HOE35567.1 ROK family protein [Anaerolineaceae bacterium]HOT24947.1 ROK family protein [Anaerolineaceae bacterium]HQH57540.1 ROK family protein [Anaerolineaceae bacterium]